MLLMPDGMAALQVDIKRSEGPDETWYFDPDTYLEIARDGTGVDMGGASFPLRTIFDDFREVNGVMVPHWIETEWYTRHRVFEVTGAEINPEIDEKVFGLPVSTGMENLQGMKGTWDVKVEVRRRPGAPWDESRAKAEIVTFMNGALIVEHYQSDNVEVMRSLSYDPFKSTYRMTSVHGQRPYQDILEGNWQEPTEKEGEEGEEGVKMLALNNAETDTSFNMFGQNMHSGWALAEVGEDGFVVELSTSRDGGENWFNNARLTYAKPGTLPAMEEPAGAE